MKCGPFPRRRLCCPQRFQQCRVGGGGGPDGRYLRPPFRTARAVVEREIRRARRVEIKLQLATFSRFCTPFLRAGLPPARETAVLAHPSPRRGGGRLAPSPRCRPRVTQLCVWCVPGCRGHRVPRAPLAGTGVTRAGASSLIRAHAPDHHPPRASGLPVARAVFAGSRRSLLGDGPSRHHLCGPCAGARTPRKPADDAANYLTTLAPYLDCPTALQSGWPIATGILEV